MYVRLSCDPVSEEGIEEGSSDSSRTPPTRTPPPAASSARTPRRTNDGSRPQPFGYLARQLDRSQSTVWDVANLLRADRDEKTGHGTQKPVEVMARPMRNHGGPGDVVYDPFAGSGTSVVAAQQAERRCVAVELAPGYCDVAVARWEKLTGHRAERRRLDSRHALTS